MNSMSPLPTHASLSFIPDSNSALASELTRLAGHINAAQYRFIKLLAALIERDAWDGGSGVKSPAHWLNYYCGIDFGAAREKVRVAKALNTLPLIDRAFASGAISYSKVRAMSRTATPENEADLLNIAQHGTAQHVEKLVRQHQRVLRLNRKEDHADSENTTQHQAREFSWFYDEDGMLLFRGRFSPEEGAVLIKALEAAMDVIEQEEAAKEDGPDVKGQATDVSAETSDQAESDSAFPQKCDESTAHSGNGDYRGHKESGKNVSAETSEDSRSEEKQPTKTFPQKRADALVHLAEQFLQFRQQNSSTADRYQIYIHFDARANSELRQIGMPATLDDGPPLPEATFKRLACDASVVPVARDDTGNVLNIGRKSRAVPPAIRRALKIRDGECRYPGCCQTRYVDAHHIRHWCDGGETSLDNLVLLCRHHHRLLHEGGFSIEKRGDEAKPLRFVNKHGKEIKRALYPQFEETASGDNDKVEIESGNERLGLAIDATTAITRWQGERMDYGMAIDGLLRAG